MSTQLSDFDYDLPASAIAQTPADQREHAKLMHVCKQTGDLVHHSFSHILDILNPGDTLIINNTQVIPARIMAQRETGGKVEIMLITPINDTEWQVMLNPAKRIKPNETLIITPNLSCKVIEKHTVNQLHHVAFVGESVSQETIFQAGTLPLPPYVKPTTQTQSKLNTHYQTVFAKHQGAVAAPTAGLHFSTELLQKLQNKGIHIHPITLHVGYGTFQPLNDTTYHHNTLHTEHYIMPPNTAQHLNKTRAQGSRVIAVGTTVARTLESNFSHNQFHSGSFHTQLFIKPGYTFQTIDGLITNFHLPKSSLLCLVSAFCGLQTMHHAYQTAITEEYRFYSFGDAMIIV